MRRRDFIYLTGLGTGASLLPNLSLFAKEISIEDALNPVDVAIKKKMADVALNAAKSLGATYT
jgi:TldD protein